MVGLAGWLGAGGTVHFWRRILCIGEIKGKEASIGVYDLCTDESD